ncbi:MAG: transcription initiation protein [Planctomycetes bacterium]|nr:transcription initiation protein [Planctomycetota bacterium]
MAKFLVMLTEDPAYWAKYTPEQMGDVIRQYVAWGMKMQATRRMKVGHKLVDEGGKRLTAARGRLKVTDGPYAESHEVVGGFYVMEADSYDQAAKLLAGHPHLAHGQRIDLRAIETVGGRRGGGGGGGKRKAGAKKPR